MSGQADRCVAGRLVATALVTAGLLVTATGTGAQSTPQPATDEAPVLKPPPQPSLNFYGSPGLIDMPSGEMLPDGQFTAGISRFGGQTRYNLTFQATPWMSASFRYNGIQDLNQFGFSTYYDRSFDVRFRLLEENGYRPGVTLGLQDFAGTGLYSAEYIVATKSFETAPFGRSRNPGKLKVTAGLGWGRLGSNGAIGGTGSRPVFDGNSSSGGELSYDQWFRGPVAPFGGIEWQANDRLGLKLEYSSDAYVLETETSSVFERKSSLNFGVEYQATPRTRIGAYYLYGSEFGVNLQFQLNPKYPPTLMGIPAPQPVAQRPSRASDPGAWETGWAARPDAGVMLRDRLEPLLRADGLLFESLTVDSGTAELRYRNIRYLTQAVTVGRAARALARVMPASVETFRLVPVAEGMGLSAVTLRRSDLEALEFDGDATDALRAVTGIGEIGPLPAGSVGAGPLYPEFNWYLSPYFSPAYFDPEQPLRMDVGLDLGAIYRPAPGWRVAGVLRQKLAGNVDEGRVSPSQLPPVRTDQALYAQFSTTINNLYGARYWRPGPDLYARTTVGYFESAYGGMSTELLWKPVSSPLALGVEANYALKRDYDQLFGFQDYRVFTGHASAYMDFRNGFLGQIDVGRYLAGDVGVTFGIDRVFNNGWSVGGFFTMTNASSEEFGEGSFDKGIRFNIPVGWFLGKPSQRSIGTTIRPIQRDGGARVHVPGRLYQLVRGGHRKALDDQWPEVWE
ncbi:MAG: YjbH domain-containing protein [Pseudomonadota bacterium]